MIKFKMYSEVPIESYMNTLADKLSSISLGNTRFVVRDRSIICGLQDDTKGINPKIILKMDNVNVLRAVPIGATIPENEPDKSYTSVLLDLINALDGLGYNEALEFINKLSKKE